MVIKMKQYNDTIYAILGILTTDCRSGYAIKQLIDRSLTHFWKISYGQIYPTLKLLVEEELATITTSAQQGKPDRHEYELTAKGRSVLHEWLEQPIKQIPVERNEVLLKLFFGSHQSRQQSIALVQDYKQKLEARLQTYLNIEQSILQFAKQHQKSTVQTPDADIQQRHMNQQQDEMFWLITLDYGKRTTIAAIEWCISTLEQFSTME